MSFQADVYLTKLWGKQAMQLCRSSRHFNSLYNSSAQTMNRQFSRLLTSLILLASLAFVGCDLGTYNKRFKERNKPAAKKPAADDKAEEAKSDSGDSE